MIEVRLADTFSQWLSRLGDRAAVDRIVARLRRFELGNLGDIKNLGEGVAEARIDFGPGYRLYFVRRGAVLIVMICGGDKSSQRRDIAKAKAMAKEV